MASPGELTASAVDQTGLEDFGDDSFREGLEILLRALRDEARLNERGEGFIYARIGMHLRQRLQVEDWYRRHPEIDDVPIDAPLFGLGLPRTGSTALSFLLAQDPQRPVPPKLGVGSAVPAAVHRRRRRPADTAGTTDRARWQQESRAHRHPRPDGVSGSDGP